MTVTLLHFHVNFCCDKGQKTNEPFSVKHSSFSLVPNNFRYPYLEAVSNLIGDARVD